ncbi:MAG: hypothetical protein J6O24_03115 [Succinivibrio sp.]|nr:hypothetical protein [Succinivibrio sp.]
MKKKTIGIVSSCAVAVAAVVYASGVYFTKSAVDNEIEKINDISSQGENPPQEIASVAHLNVEDKGFFSQKGTLTLSYPPYVNFSVPVKIEHGFLNAEISFDTKDINNYLSRQKLLSLDGNTLKSSAKLKISALSQSATLKLKLDGRYLDRSINPISASVKAEFDKDENVDLSSEFNSINLDFIGKVDSLKYKTKFTGIGALKKFDEMELSTKGVKTIGFKSDSLKASLEAKNQKDDGTFDLKFKAKGDNLDYIKDYDAAITVRGITADALSSLYTGAVTGLPNSIPNIKGIDIDKFESVIDDKIGSLIGLYDKKKLPIKASGKLDFKASEDESVPVVNGNINVTTNEDPGKTMFFVKKDKEYSSEIKIVDSEVYVNNERMM